MLILSEKAMDRINRIDRILNRFKKNPPGRMTRLNWLTRRIFVLLGAEYPLDISSQNLSSQGYRSLFGPATVDDEALGKRLGQDSLIHRELRQREFELVHVAV